MLKPDGPDRFRVDFAQARRERGWRAVFAAKESPVDAWAIGQVVIAALGRCPFKSVTGVPQPWNEYSLFLAREDHDRLRPVEAALQEELAPLLYEELVRIGASTVGALTVRLLVDDADDVAPGAGILRARHVPDAEAPAPGAGEITVRLDKLKAPPPTPTQRVGGLVAVTPNGVVALPAGARVVLGRAHPGAGPDHVALPGAGPRINRRQVAVKVDGAEAEVTREPGDTNPVAVAGRALAPGESVRASLPVEIALSGGELKLVIEAR
ncbi:MAG: FhaA domain-containing protein [Myxococcota bacterium]